MIKPGTYHHGDLRAAIIAEAIAIAEEEGVSALSVRAVARRLGVSHAAPARHFASRADLLLGLATAAFSLFAEELERSHAEAGPGNTHLAELGTAYIRFALRRPALFRLMFNSEATEQASAPDPAFQAANDRAFGILASAVRSAMGRDTREGEVQQAALLAWAGAHGAAMLWLDGPLRSMGEQDFMAWAAVSMERLSRVASQGGRDP